MGTEATSMCQDDSLCAGLKAIIDRAVHGVQAIWDTKYTMEYWVFILLDTKNAFKKTNLIEMLWTVCHLWPSGSHFVFNFDHHWSFLIFCNRNGTASFLHSREGMTQGDPKAMVDYGIVILLLIKNLKAEYLDITQPWCADNSGALGTFANVESYFNSLELFDPGRGYYPKPSKSVFIVHPENIEAVKRFFLCHGFKM